MSEDKENETDKKVEEEVKDGAKAAPDAKDETPKAAAAADDAPAKEAAAEAPAEEKSEKLKKAESIINRGRGPRTPSGHRDDVDEDIFEKVVFINRCSKVVKGGRRFSFSALVVTGDKEGKVGFGFGKALEVAECIKKASEYSRRNMEEVKIGENTIPHPVMGRHGGGRVLLLPASPGTGLIAGGGVRAVVEAAGIKDVLAKSMGSNNHANVVKATLDALHQLRTKEEIYSARGKRTESQKAL